MADNKETKLTPEQEIEQLKLRVETLEELIDPLMEALSANKPKAKVDATPLAVVGKLQAKSNHVRLIQNGVVIPVDLSTLEAKELKEVSEKFPNFFQPKK